MLCAPNPTYRERVLAVFTGPPLYDLRTVLPAATESASNRAYPPLLHYAVAVAAGSTAAKRSRCANWPSSGRRSPAPTASGSATTPRPYCLRLRPAPGGRTPSSPGCAQPQGSWPACPRPTRSRPWGRPGTRGTSRWCPARLRQPRHPARRLRGRNLHRTLQRCVLATQQEDRRGQTSRQPIAARESPVPNRSGPTPPSMTSPLRAVSTTSTCSR